MTMHHPRVVQSFMILLLIGASTAGAQTQAVRAVDGIAGYRIMTTRYSDLSGLTGFRDDPDRSYPEREVKSAKIIDKRLWNTPTIQRFAFYKDQLVRVSIIFHPPEQWPEERVKNVIAAQWGDPGAKRRWEDGNRYVWKGSVGTIVILPADGGRWMASCQSNADFPVDTDTPIKKKP